MRIWNPRKDILSLTFFSIDHLSNLNVRVQLEAPSPFKVFHWVLTCATIFQALKKLYMNMHQQVP